MYSVAEAARYIDLPPATLRTWVHGRHYAVQEGTSFSEPLIIPPDPDDARLSFHNLVEVHVLKALRTRHQTMMKAIRTAIAYAEEALQINRLLLSEELLTAGGQLFLEHFGGLLNLSRSGQIAMRALLLHHLQRIERGEDQLPTRLYPISKVNGKDIVIDPRISFGQPVIKGTGVLTSVVARRIDAGESTADLAEDYGIENKLIESALIYERAA